MKEQCEWEQDVEVAEDEARRIEQEIRRERMQEVLDETIRQRRAEA